MRRLSLFLLVCLVWSWGPSLLFSEAPGVLLSPEQAQELQRILTEQEKALTALEMSRQRALEELSGLQESLKVQKTLSERLSKEIDELKKSYDKQAKEAKVWKTLSLILSGACLGGVVYAISK